MSQIILTLLIFLCIKHWFADALWQYPRHFMNKGFYGAWGGIEHAGIHAIGTFLCITMLGFGITAAICLAVIDGLVHYHADWFKMRMDARRNLSALTVDVNARPCRAIYSNEYFYWLVADQCAHFATYVVIAFFISAF